MRIQKLSFSRTTTKSSILSRLLLDLLQQGLTDEQVLQSVQTRLNFFSLMRPQGYSSAEYKPLALASLLQPPQLPFLLNLTGCPQTSRKLRIDFIESGKKKPYWLDTSSLTTVSTKESRKPLSKNKKSRTRL